MSNNLPPISYDVFTARVMRRIYVMYFLRQVGKPVILEAVLLSACTFVISFMVSFRHIVTNMTQVPAAPTMLPLIRFFWVAFLNTNNIVKMLSLAICLTAVLFCYTLFYSLGKRFVSYSGYFLSQIFSFVRNTRARTAI